MVTVRRWWGRKGLQIGLLAVILGGAGILRQTQGAMLLEVYQVFTRPLQMLQSGQTPEERLEERLKDAQFMEMQTRIQELENQNKQLQSLLGYVQTQPVASR